MIVRILSSLKQKRMALYRCEIQDLEELVSFLDMFHEEIGIDKKDASGYRKDAEAFIREICIFGKMNRGIAQQAVNMLPMEIWHP